MQQARWLKNLRPHQRTKAIVSFMPVGTFEGQLTRANIQLAVRSGVLEEAQAARYWQKRRKFRTLSDSNSAKTIASRTAEFNAIKELILQKMNTSRDDILAATTAEKRRLEEALCEKDAELQSLRKRLRDSGCSSSPGV